MINYRGKKWVNYGFAKKQIFTVNPSQKNRDKAECNIKKVVFSKEKPLIGTINIQIFTVINTFRKQTVKF